MSERIFTRDELRKYDGHDGHPAYLVINGIVYDVTNNPAWQDGTHHSHQAGYDLTDMLFDASPHKDRVLSSLPQVGILADEETD